MTSISRAYRSERGHRDLEIELDEGTWIVVEALLEHDPPARCEQGAVSSVS